MPLVRVERVLRFAGRQRREEGRDENEVSESHQALAGAGSDEGSWETQSRQTQAAQVEVKGWLPCPSNGRRSIAMSGTS